MKKNLVALLGILIGLLTCKEAYAYIDPGSGSYLFQILIAGFLAAGFALKTFWGRVTNFFVSRFRKKDDTSK